MDASWNYVMNACQSKSTMLQTLNERNQLRFSWKKNYKWKRNMVKKHSHRSHNERLFTFYTTFSLGLQLSRDFRIFTLTFPFRWQAVLSASHSQLSLKPSFLFKTRIPLSKVVLQISIINFFFHLKQCGNVSVSFCQAISNNQYLNVTFLLYNMLAHFSLHRLQ